jgi:hypothetical protein
VSSPDENYIQEILQQLPDGLTQAEFFARCHPDVNGGWGKEVGAAWLRYKAENRAAKAEQP